MPEPRLTDWNSGDIISHERLQEPVDALRDLFRGGDATTPRGQSPRPINPRLLWLLGKIASTGPQGQSDYTDERHWVRVHGIAATTLQSSQITLQARYDLPTDPNNTEETPVPLTVTATNPAALSSHGHILLVDAPVILVPMYDAQDTPSLHYLIVPIVLPAVIPVSLTQVGGANGNATTAPTYTYDVKAMTTTAAGGVTVGVTLGTGKSPMVARPVGGVTAATLGLAIPASDGGYALLIAYEKPGTTHC